MATMSSSWTRRAIGACASLFLIFGAPLYAANLKLPLLNQVLITLALLLVLSIIWAFFGHRFVRLRDKFAPNTSQEDLLHMVGLVASITIPANKIVEDGFISFDESCTDPFSAPESVENLSNIPSELRNGTESQPDKYWPAALGTLRLLVHHQNSSEKGLRLKGVRLIWTDALSPAQHEPVERYLRHMIRRIEPDLQEQVAFHRRPLEVLADPEGMISLYESAIKSLRRDKQTPSGRSYLGIDATTGTVLHSLAAAAVAESLDARLVYNLALKGLAHDTYLLCVDV